MSIKLAVLSILGRKPSSGYDIKKTMQRSPYMPWSGNNNQIYKALVELSDDGLVSGETLHREGSPSKKVYTLTAEGRNELNDLASRPPEPPEFKKPFLLQLASADALSDGELLALVDAYENEVRLQLAYHEGLMRRMESRGDEHEGEEEEAEEETPGDRRALLLKLVYENLVSSIESELEWTERLRSALKKPERREHE